ncbi:MAG: SAM-dependent methyltransferase, partial [Planctomycetota bacterium]
ATLAGIAARLSPGAPFVAVMLHPTFRSPRQTAWGWDTTGRGAHKQYRRVDAYLSESCTPITMNPGKAAHGASPVETVTFHRPLSAYVRSLTSAGFAIEAMEEWPSLRTSEPGPRADEENRARAEIPLFLGIRAVRSERTR